MMMVVEESALYGMEIGTTLSFVNLDLIATAMDLLMLRILPLKTLPRVS